VVELESLMKSGVREYRKNKKYLKAIGKDESMTSLSEMSDIRRKNHH
jgi:hypothetical protein